MDIKLIAKPSWLKRKLRTQTCNSQITKLPELTFHAVLSAGTPELRFERTRG
jgi:hypothetical protein